MITLGPTEWMLIYMGGAALATYILARYPLLPGMLKRNVAKVKKELDKAKADGIPEQLQGLWDAAYAAVLAFENALEDDRITYGEAKELGKMAYNLGTSALGLIYGR